MKTQKTNYVDGFVMVVPKKNIVAYKKMAEEAGKMWMKYGALSYKECIVEDPKPKLVKLTFPKLIQAKANESVWFSYIEFKSRAHRDQVNKKVMAEMHKIEGTDKDEPMPFDMERMSYGGFEVMVNF